MKKTVLALAAAALTLAAVSAAQAAPMAPLSSGVATGHDNLTQVQYWWHHRHWGHCGWGPYHHWRCW